MVVTREIGTYKVLLLDEQTQANGTHAGFVYFYAPSGDYLGYVGGVRDGARLPETAVHRNGIVHIHVRETEMRALIGMMQDEPAVLLRYDAATGRGAVSPDAIATEAPRAGLADRASGGERSFQQS